MGIADLARSSISEERKELEKIAYESIERYFNEKQENGIMTGFKNSRAYRVMINEIIPDIATELKEAELYFHYLYPNYTEDDWIEKSYNHGLVYRINKDPNKAVEPSGRKLSSSSAQ